MILKAFQFKWSLAAFVLISAGCSRTERHVTGRNDVPVEREAAAVAPPQRPAHAPKMHYRQNDKPVQMVRSDSGDGDITLDEVLFHVEHGTALVVDARGRADFQDGHVPGAINVPASEMEQAVAQELGDVDLDQLIIIYCQSAACHSSDMLREYLAGLGFTNLRVYSPGWQVLARAPDLR